MKFADLHVHTFYSDSTFSPEEVMLYAAERGLNAIAICDHDCLDGIEPCIKIGTEKGIEIIPGIEMTAEKTDVEIHILGYFLDWKLKWLNERLKEMQDSRIYRIYKMVDKLKDLNIVVDPMDVLRISGRGAVGRLHLAKAMLNAGKIKNIKQAFEKYIGFSKPCYVSNVRFSPQEAIEMILRAGGVPVLAHPSLIGKDDYIEEFISYGLRGIEVYHTEHKPSVTRHYENMAKHYNLIMTGGSDCHGLGKKRILLGEVRVPYETVEALKAESEKIRGDKKLGYKKDE